MATGGAQEEKLYENVEGIREQLTCSICLSEFSDPRTLPCLHNYCFKCIEGHLKAQSGKKTARCPDCQANFDVPRNGAFGIKKNFILSNLIDKFHEKQIDGEALSCSTKDCRSRDIVPVAYCKDRCDYLCDECFAEHSKSRLTSSHIVERLLSANVQYPYCQGSGHGSRKVQVRRYCEGHEKFLCLECCQYNHSQCNYIDAEKQIKLTKEKLENLQRNAINYVDELNNILHKSYEESNKAEKDIQSVRNYIEKTAKEEKEKIDQEKEKLLTLLSDVDAKRSQIIINLDGHNAAAIAAVDEISMLVQSKNIISITNDFPALDEKWQTLASKNTYSLKWEKRDEVIPGMDKSFVLGDILLQTVEEKLQQPSIASGKEKYTIKLQCNKEVVGIAILMKLLIIAHANDNRVWFYGLCGTFKRWHKINGRRSFYEVCACETREETLALLDEMSNSVIIALVQNEGDYPRINKWKSVPLEFEAFSLSYSSYNKRLIATDIETNIIHLLNSNGNESKAIIVNWFLDALGRCIQLADGSFLYVNSRDHLVWLHSRGKKILGKYGNEPHHQVLECVSHFTETNDGHIIVADSGNGSVLVIHREKGLIRYIISPGEIENPNALFLDKDGKLYIGHGNKQCPAILTVVRYGHQNTKLPVVNNTIKKLDVLVKGMKM